MVYIDADTVIMESIDEVSNRRAPDRGGVEEGVWGVGLLSCPIAFVSVSHGHLWLYVRRLYNSSGPERVGR